MVVGAGPWGLATAWQAARRGAAVTVVGGDAPPAAHVAAGMLGPWSEAEEGEEDLHALMVAALDRWPAFAAAVAGDAGRDAGFRRTGAILAAIRPEHVPLVRRRLDLLDAWGRPAAWQAGSALRDHEPGLGPAVAGGAVLADEHQVEPRAFLAALRAAAERAGARLVRGTVEEILRRPRAVGVRLADGRGIGAGRVVLAAGWAAGRLAGRVAVRGVSGQILRLRARPGAPLPVATTIRTPSVYLAPRDGELVVGATMEEGADRPVTAGGVAGLLVEALRAVPEAAELELAEASAGVRPATPDGRAVIGVDAADGLVWATGGYRHGVLLTPLAAEAAADLALGGPAPEWARDLAPERLATCA